MEPAAQKKARSGQMQRQRGCMIGAGKAGQSQTWINAEAVRRRTWNRQVKDAQMISTKISR